MYIYIYSLIARLGTHSASDAQVLAASGLEGESSGYATMWPDGHTTIAKSNKAAAEGHATLSKDSPLFHTWARGLRPEPVLTAFCAG